MPDEPEHYTPHHRLATGWHHGGWYFTATRWGSGDPEPEGVLCGPFADEAEATVAAAERRERDGVTP